MKTQQIRKSGFTLVEMMIVLCIVGLLAAIAIPSMMRSRASAQKGGCVNNLRQLEAAKQQWAMESKASSADTPVEADLQPYLTRGNVMPICPAGGRTSTFTDTYSIRTVGESPECLIYPTAHILLQ